MTMSIYLRNNNGGSFAHSQLLTDDCLPSVWLNVEESKCSAASNCIIVAQRVNNKVRVLVNTFYFDGNVCESFPFLTRHVIHFGWHFVWFYFVFISNIPVKVSDWFE